MRPTCTRLAWSALAALVLAFIPGSLRAQAPTCPTPTLVPGAGIYIVGEATGNLTVFNDKGALLDGGDANFDVADGFAVGDVDGDGIDEVVVAGDLGGMVEIREIGNITGTPISWFGDFTTGDGFAIGNVLGMDRAHIVIAGDGTNRIDVFSIDGFVVRTFASSFNPLDRLAVGNLRGDERDEILVVGDVTGNVDIYDASGTLIDTLDLNWDIADGFAVGNLDGSGYDEILIASDVDHDAYVYDANGVLLRNFDVGFTIGDGFAVGSVNPGFEDEIIVAGEALGDVDIYDGVGTHLGTFDGDFTALDGLAIGTRSFPDWDQDGLLDSWEEFGFDGDGDTVIDVDLPAAGALKCHKDLLLEFDWITGQEPTRWAIGAVKRAFARAPINAGGWQNPDVRPGINLIVDTGSLTDPTFPEGVGIPGGSCTNGIDDDNDGDIDAADDTCDEGGPCDDGRDNDGDGMTDGNDPSCWEGFASCSDGEDNDGDGLIDANDPSCLVGDDLGGGNALSGPIDPLGSTFYAAKAANFSPLRARIFRYAISGNPDDEDTGGRGEIGGNDFVEYNHDEGTIMHELGHTLGLKHGGTDHSNCKPNFLSVMNYDHQGGILQSGGGWIIDYSPPRRSDGSRGGALPTIVEDSLDETAILDPGDPDNMMIFTDDDDEKRTWRLDQVVDWEGDGRADDTSTIVNVDDSGTDGEPDACLNGIITSTLEGHDDWSVIQLNFRGFGDAADAAINPVEEREPRLDEVRALQRIIQRANLSVTMTDVADPAVAGTMLSYVTTVRNEGKNATSASHLRIDLPAGVTHVSTPGCLDGNGLLSCDIGMMHPGEERVFDTTVSIAPDLVHLAGAPVTITATATIRNVAGDDPQSANDVATQDTLVKAEADLSMSGASVTGAPAEMLIGETATATLNETISSAGPSSPMDARVTRTATMAADATITLAEPVVVSPALANGEVRLLTSDISFGCTQPGARAFDLSSTVTPARPDDTDPVAGNESADAAFVVECVVPVSIRVRPVMKAGKRGVVPVEIRSNEAGEYGLPVAFDAALIDASSVRFGAKDAIWQEAGGAPEQHGSTHGGEDRTLHFVREATGLDGTEAEACVKGTYTTPSGDTFKFFGCDAVRW